ncbi:MAG: hypothetical protein Q9221_004200 [Calogaya cf. arnoldii]
MLFSILPLPLALLTSIPASPLASPESVGAGGDCSPPDVEIFSTEEQKPAPYLVSGARSDANPHGVPPSKDHSINLSPPGEFTSIFKKVTAGLDFSINYSVGKATAFNTITGCPPNDLYNYTITLGLQDYRYIWHITGNLKYGAAHDPLARCSGDRLKYRGQTVLFTLDVPATQAGAKDDAAAEVQFQCCTDSRGETYPVSPVSPDAS